MRKRYLVVLLCLLAVVGVVISAGCETVAARRGRIRTINRDIRHVPDDLDWMLGLDEESILYEETYPPYW